MLLVRAVTQQQDIAAIDSLWKKCPDVETCKIYSRRTTIGRWKTMIKTLKDLGLLPHGRVKQVARSVTSDEFESQEDDIGLPFHPTCFEIFNKSPLSDSTILTSTAYGLGETSKAYKQLFEQFPRAFEVKNGNEQWWNHEPGNEFLVANPVDVPGFSMLMKKSERESSFGSSDRRRPYNTTDSVFHFSYKNKHEHWKMRHKTPPPSSSSDVFSRLPNELRYMIIRRLSAKDIANLKLVTSAYRQLSVSVFRTLLLHEMPWFWEARDLPVDNTDWYFLFLRK
ncbi:hypothetical protein IFR05_010413 [Cadophora sp. M221]|nr:hypothetical protein IFR05_010413 [Cadophora sp. M221]